MTTTEATTRNAEDNFVLDNIDLLSHYDLMRLYPTVRSYKLKAEFGFHFDKLSGPFDFAMGEHGNYESYEAVCERFRRMLADKFDSDMEVARTVYAHDSLCRYVHRVKPIKLGFTCHLSEYGIQHLMAAVIYAINGKLHSDWSHVVPLTDALRERDTIEVEGQTLTFKRFQNGRCDVKGLTEEQVVKFIALVELIDTRRYSKHQNRPK